jgi:predicted amidohydrolase YtcJ
MTATPTGPERDLTRFDLPGCRVIPGLNDSSLHVIRGGLPFNLPLHAVTTA